MAYKTSYELHHHFPRLAEESGFTFNTHRPRVHIDWNKIKLIDLDGLIRERKFILIEQHLNDILDCVFESEFDVRILDEGVLKIFRLAQLAVEYQQFCRHYLDRSVYVLREEINSLAQELDATKKQLQEKEEELRKFRKRSRQSFKTPLPYGNDNIAAMILKTLSNKGDMFPSTSNVDVQYNKCKYCDKIFLNQLYLQSHISRRHIDVMEAPQREKQTNENSNENVKMNAEIMELKSKLKDMEQIIINSNSQQKSADKEQENKPAKEEENKIKELNVKDAEVSTHNDEYLLNKFEQWKKEEHEKHDKEIKLLRSQILETINSIKDKQIQPSFESKDSKVIEQLHSTLLQQGAELLALKQELSNSKLVANVKEDNATNKEAEAQIAFWTKRAEVQSKQYDALLQKLNDVAKDAKQSRALAETERERAAQLQTLLQQSLQRRESETVQTSTDDLLTLHNKQASSTPKHDKSNHKSKQITNRQTLENLHKKAQELLNIASISSTSTESSSSSEEQAKPPPPRKNKLIESSPKKSSSKIQNKIDTLVSVHSKYNDQIETKDKFDNIKHKDNDTKKILKAKVTKPKNDKIKSHTKQLKDNVVTISGSPVRVIRAKLTEEVNHRLVSFGVDPLKSRLPQNDFQKQKMELQQLNEAKSKKSPSYEKVRYSILAYLDANTEDTGKKTYVSNEYASPAKTQKSFRTISSVISNVKSRAMSLVKLNETTKEKLRSINTDVTKRAMTLLKTPPDSGHESPTSSGRSPKKNKKEDIIINMKPNQKDKFKYYQDNVISDTKNSKIVTNKKIVKQPKTEVINYDTEDDSNVSDQEFHNTMAIDSKTSKSIENLIKSPARRPASADLNSVHTVRKYAVENGDLFMRTQSATNLSENGNSTQPISITSKAIINNENSSDEDAESLSDILPKKVISNENIENIKQTKSVLKNASSTSSLNKKKVLFDMDAIQMKSVSASPSQSITEKSDGNERYELGLVNLDGEEWDISSIENEPLKNDTKIQINTRTSPKIAELKKTIESQLARRNDTPTAIVGGIDVLAGPMVRIPSAGGSNTSLGSSILDDSDAVPPLNHKTIVKPRKVAEKDDSELDISEFSIDGITVMNKNESF